MQPHTTNKAPSEDPLIFAIKTGRTVDATVIDRAIAYRLSEMERINDEIQTLQDARARAVEYARG